MGVLAWHSPVRWPDTHDQLRHPPADSRPAEPRQLATADHSRLRHGSRLGPNVQRDPLFRRRP